MSVKEPPIVDQGVYRRFTTIRHSAIEPVIGPADDGTCRIGPATGAQPERHAIMPKAKSKRKTTRPSAPPARQAPRSAKLIRLAGETVAQGMNLVADGRAADALALTDAFLAKNRATADVLHLRGYAQVMMERTQEALEDFRRAVKLDPDTPAYRNSLGIAVQMAGDHEEAKRQFRRACQLEAANPTYWFNLGNALRDLGASADAAEAYQGALRHLPEDPEILNNLGIVLRDDGRVDEAVDIFRKAHDLTGREPRILANLGIALLECADRDPDGEAEPLLKAAVAQSPDTERTEPLRALMQLYLSRGKGAQALAVARQLARLAADDLHAQVSLALAFLKAGMPDQAVDIAEGLQAEHPDKPEFAVLHARSLVEAGRYDAVLEVSDELSAGHPLALDVLRWRFEALFWGGNVEQLREEFERAKAEHPKLPFARLQEARLAFVADDLDRTIACLTEQLEESGTDPGLRVELGLDQVAAGYLAEGWRNYRYRHQNGPHPKAATANDEQAADDTPRPYLPVDEWQSISLPMSSPPNCS